MEQIVKLSCEPGHFIASLEYKESVIEGFGDSMSEALYDLANEISIHEWEKFD